MKKIRIGNDFVFSWAIERGGIPEPLETVLEKQLYMIVSGIKTKIDDYIVSENNVIIEFTTEMLSKLGVYTLVFTYILPDTSLSDNDRKCAVDIDAFQIVPKTAMADDVSEFAVTSDMAIAFKGEKGDPFTFEDFTPEQLALLKGDKGDPFTFDDFTPEQLAVLKGEKGDPFTFDDFTPEQLAVLKGEKGDPFTFDDFTPEQLAVLKGEKGDSAYQIWLDAGNIGTEEDFLSSLKGEKGDMADVSMTIDEYGNLIATIYN